MLVHGFTQTGRSWATIAADLGTDHEVVLVDAPGHGGSAAVRADLARGAELLVDACGAGIYVGYSMGGRLALHAALAAPSSVSALVLVGATAGIDDPGERAERRAADDALAASIERDGVATFVDRWLAGPLFATLPLEAAGREERLSNTAEGLADSLRTAGTGAQEPLWDRLGELPMPVLVVAGEHDAKFTQVGERLAAAIPDATFVTISGAGHAAHLEQPDAFLAVLRLWLAWLQTR